jgi:hypothetical protein
VAETHHCASAILLLLTTVQRALNSAPLELVGLVNYKATANTTVSPNMFVGLTNGSSTFGVGVEFAFKFGRY